MPDAYTDLVLRLRFAREDRDDHNQVLRRTYAVEMVCTPVFSAAPFDPLAGANTSPEVVLDLVELDEQRINLNWAAYGDVLGRMLLAHPAVDKGWARAVDKAGDGVLRIRLDLDEDDRDLHRVIWEALRLPGSNTWLATHERFYLTRHLTSGSGRDVTLPNRPALRAVVAVANPPGLEEIDADTELQNARAGLENVKITPLVAPGAATLDAIAAELKQGCDILYLVCHGLVVNQMPYLFLFDPATQNRVPANQLIARFSQLDATLPTLIVLVSCQSSGDGTGDALQALGPQLIALGIPAVLAMQGNFTMDSAASFMPAFLKTLQRDGRIDRAVALARGEIRNQPDVWMPVLFTRLIEGRLWQIGREVIDVPAGDVAAQRRLLTDLTQNRDRATQERAQRQNEFVTLTSLAAPSAADAARVPQIMAEIQNLNAAINGYNKQIGDLEAQLPPEAPVPAPRRGALATRMHDLAGARVTRLATHEALLWEALLTLDCQQQSTAFGQIAGARRPSVVLLLGDQQVRIRYGLQQLLLRLFRDLFRLAPRQVDHRSLQPPEGAVLDSTTAWELLAERLESAPGAAADRPRRLGEILSRQLREKHVVFTVEQARDLPDLPDLIANFWESLIAEVSLPPTGGQLFLLILDDAARFAHAAPHPALQILQLVQYPRDHFDIWYTTQEDDLPAPLQGFQAPQLNQLWQASQNGVADLVLTQLCEPVQVDPQKLFALE